MKTTSEDLAEILEFGSVFTPTPTKEYLLKKATFILKLIDLIENRPPIDFEKIYNENVAVKNKPSLDAHIDEFSVNMGWEKIINEPMSIEEMNVVSFVNHVFTHKNAHLILKGILHRFLDNYPETTYILMEQAVTKHPRLKYSSFIEFVNDFSN